MPAENNILKRPAIIIVDDHRIVADGITHLLASINARRIDCVMTSESALSQIGSISTPYDIAIVDIELPDSTGTTLMRKIREQSPTTKIIVYTMHEETWVVRELEDLHVEGIVLKGESTTSLLLAVEQVLDGFSYRSRRFLSMCEDAKDSTLTERETTVLKLISEGLTSKQIAERLFLSENTIEYHRKRLMRHFAAENVVQLVIRAERQGLLPK